MPVTIPVTEPMVAMLVLLLLHVPPLIICVSVSGVSPIHIDGSPVTEPAADNTVITLLVVAPQPLVSVTDSVAV